MPSAFVGNSASDLYLLEFADPTLTASSLRPLYAPNGPAGTYVSAWTVDNDGDLWVLFDRRLVKIAGTGTMIATNVAEITLPSGKVACSLCALPDGRFLVGTTTAEVYPVALA
jgi:hypothetical protein